MRMGILICVVLGCALPAQASNYADAVKADGPVAYWRLNEAAGATQLQPEAGYGTVPLDAFNGTLATGGAVNVDAPAVGVAGVPFADEPDNKAVFLPNTGPHPDYPCTYDDYLVTNSEINLSGTGDWAVEMWFRHNGDSTGFPWGSSSYTESLMNNVDLGTNVDAFMLEIESPGSPDHVPTNFRMKTEYDIHNTPVATDFKPDVPGDVDWADWHHIVFTTHEGTGSIYLDGDLLGSMPWNGTLTSTGEILAFGQDRGWKGEMDEIALYNKGLTDAQVAAHYEAAAIPEPSTFLLLAIGMASLLACRRCR